MKQRTFTVFQSTLIVLMATAFNVGLIERADATIMLSATDAGFVTEAGGSAKGDGTLTPGATYNYSVGREVHYETGVLLTPTVPMDRKNYFIFDLSSISAPIVSATLEVYAGTYESVDSSETFDLLAPADPGAALGDADFLLTKNLVGSTAFDDSADPAIGVAGALYGNLAGGPPPPLGSISISAADDSTTLSISLSSDGITYLNDFVGGAVVIGGSVPTVLPPVTPQQPFGGTGPDILGGDSLTPKLVLTVVPEPGSLVLVTSGLFGLYALRRCRLQT